MRWRTAVRPLRRVGERLARSSSVASGSASLAAISAGVAPLKNSARPTTRPRTRGESASAWKASNPSGRSSAVSHTAEMQPSTR